MRNFIIILVLITGGLKYFYKNEMRDFFSDSNSSAPLSISNPSIEHVSSQSQQFECSGKTRCPEMASCEEAMYYLRNCPGTQMDGDGDGVPYESQWCGS